MYILHLLHLILHRDTQVHKLPRQMSTVDTAVLLSLEQSYHPLLLPVLLTTVSTVAAATAVVNTVVMICFFFIVIFLFIFPFFRVPLLFEDYSNIHLLFQNKIQKTFSSFCDFSLIFRFVLFRYL